MSKGMLPCLGHREDYGADGWEYTCDYEHAEIDCGDCVINGGDLSPQTGKPFRGNLERYKEAARLRYEKPNNNPKGDQIYE